MKQPKRSGSTGLQTWLPWALLIAAIALFVWHSSSSTFLQDDSYITYRYARNIVRGLGPVFNPGERVEGYTNFLWMMILAGLGVVGLSFETIIALSQVLGVICGAATMVLFFLLVRRHSAGPPVLSGLAVLLFAASGSFAYWNVSGMETGLFTLLIAAAFFIYLDRKTNRNLFLSSALLGLSALTRPEGAMFMALVALHFAIGTCAREKRRALSAANFRRLAVLILPFVGLVLPLYLWRLNYYGYLFPNTFYAKTGVSVSYIRSGIDYVVDFYKAYGLWGLALFVPLGVAIARRRLNLGSPLFFAVLVIVVHSLYVVSVGGDVLRIYRFFVPVLFLFYFLLSEGIWMLPLSRGIQVMLLLGLLPLTFYGPLTTPVVYSYIQRNLFLENGLVDKMSSTGRWLNQQLAEDEWFCCTTIGAVSYFSDRSMIDMLGLTDKVIAHQPEDILGGQVYWKERNYNTRHVLEHNPKYIFFSTSIKPSAAAERALFLRPRFRKGYFACPFTIVEETYISTGIIYKAKPGADTLPLEPLAERPEFIARYVDGINFKKVGLDTSLSLFRKCIETAPPDFGYAHEWVGSIYQEMNQPDRALAFYEQAIARNDWCITSHGQLANLYMQQGRLDLAAEHLLKVVAYAPDYHEGYINLAAVYSQLKRFVDAEGVLLAAVEKWPAFLELKLRLAYTQMEAGKYDAAERVLDEVLRAYPTQRDARAILQEIGRRRARPADSIPATPPGP